VERPAPHSFAPRLEWQCSDVEGLEGFCVLARRGITIREREDLMTAHRKIVEYEVEYLRPDAEERDPVDTPRRREMALVAPWIADWNAMGLDEEGNEVQIPAPSEAGPEAFMAIDNAAYDWIVRHLLLGYKASGKAGGWVAR
jgi:hypothetical protein